MTWLCDITLSCTSLCVVSPKGKEKKRNINNNLAILPSHDSSYNNEWFLDSGAFAHFTSFESDFVSMT